MVATRYVERVLRYPFGRADVRHVFSSIGGTTAVGLVLFLGFVFVAIFAPVLAPYNPDAFSGKPLEHPSNAHLLGTNDVGQDIFSELVFGTQISLIIGVGAGLGAVFLAVVIGGAAGYIGGWLDFVLMRLGDMLLALPRLPMLILVNALIGAGVWQMVITIALLFWPTTARIIRSEVQRVRQRTYLQLAHHFGSNRLYVLRRHVLPHITPLIVFGLVTSAGRAVALEAGLAFLGLGDPAAKSWGLMMRYALNLPGLLLTDRWLWWLLPPGVCITLLILSLTLVGIGLESRLMPGLRRQ
ncbi:MAG: ABC transporter permease [Chloroflexi bacterium]|nr:ABC transporter permease [Chloroflexota bacterium]